jgi:hypothetical protein
MSMGTYGPNTEAVEAYLAQLPTLDAAAWAAARDAARASARDAAWDAARASARAAEALVVRDLITSEQFATLTGPMRAAGVTFTEHAMEA